MKSLSRMTSMEQIEYMATEARKKGMKYGEYVEKYGHNIPKPKENKREVSLWADREGKPRQGVVHDLICQDCGAEFQSKKKTAKFCEDCRYQRMLKASARRQKRLRDARKKVQANADKQ